MFYFPYLKKLEEIEIMVEKTNPGYQTAYTEFKTDNMKNIIKTGFKKVFNYNIVKHNIDGIYY